MSGYNVQSLLRLEETVKWKTNITQAIKAWVPPMTVIPKEEREDSDERSLSSYSVSYSCFFVSSRSIHRGVQGRIAATSTAHTMYETTRVSHTAYNERSILTSNCVPTKHCVVHRKERANANRQETLHHTNRRSGIDLYLPQHIAVLVIGYPCYLLITLSAFIYTPLSQLNGKHFLYFLSVFELRHVKTIAYYMYQLLALIRMITNANEIPGINRYQPG